MLKLDKAIEQARPVLGAQPRAPGTVPVRYVESELQETGRELVANNSYYVEHEPEWVPMTNEFSSMNNHNEGAYVDNNAMMLVGDLYLECNLNMLETLFLRESSVSSVRVIIMQRIVQTILNHHKDLGYHPLRDIVKDAV